MTVHNVPVAVSDPEGPIERSPAWGGPRPVAGRSIRVENLTKIYHTPIGARRVLDGISFEIHEGEKIAVLGRNGSGKSTLVKLIGGVEFPTFGSIHRGMAMSWPLGFSGGRPAS